MEKELDIETKYHKLATEYSKVRSQATVLKKAVLDEQTKNAELNDLVKKHEQTTRKREQEVESLIFRNDQLTKRIMVLQQELQVNNTSKKNKGKYTEPPPQNDMTVVNEELQKKILENAQLFNDLAEKDNEIMELKERFKGLEDMISNLQKELVYKDDCHRREKDSYRKDIEDLRKIVEKLSTGAVAINSHQNGKEKSEDLSFWKNEVEMESGV
ncbi:hypothetical protein NQ317_019289 [Molorchus minor]|uniref:Protein phosphatase 1 regulatory subunit 21 N-terminal domain-containing protein n=1 Tax=Molorchus minor TaxID=1323400 RepID=A0ABQ9J797_9CUCU|nr:hypothetical protein NQ317_019289 [Molorchus minor]